MARIGVNLRVTGHCSQGGRKYMEDMFAVAYQQTADLKDLEYAFCGIFDGHGGPQAALYAKDHLLDEVVSQKSFWSDNDDDILRAIHDGFISTHYMMWKDVDKWPKTPQGLPSTSGTTATIAFIKKGKIYIGHVGDTCIVLGFHQPGDTEWRADRLTTDHKPEAEEELKRIKNAGGKVMAKSGVHRVVWHRPKTGHQGPVRRSTPMNEIPFLAVARSLGDFWSYNSRLDQFVVSPEPDVRVFTVDTNRHKCLIFGTDGLWNILSPESAVSLVQRAESHNAGQTDNAANWLNPSKCLVDKAMEKWKMSNLRADNTSVVVLLLDPPGPPNSKVVINKGNTLFYSSQHSRQFPSSAGEDADEFLSPSGGLAIYRHYSNPSVPASIPSCSSMMISKESDSDKGDNEGDIKGDEDDYDEDEVFNEGSDNEESDYNDDTIDISDGSGEYSSESSSSFHSEYYGRKSTSPVPYQGSFSSPNSSSQLTCRSTLRRSISTPEPFNCSEVTEPLVSPTVPVNNLSTSEELLRPSSSPKFCSKRLRDALNEESSTSDVENQFVDNYGRRFNTDKITDESLKKPSMKSESVGIDSKRQRISIEKPPDNQKKSPLTHLGVGSGAEENESSVSSGEWFLDTHKPSWKTPLKTATSEGSSDIENESSTSEWFADSKKRKLSIDKKPSKLSWQKPIPAVGKVSLKRKPLLEPKRILRSGTSAAMRVKTLRSRNVDLKSSCDKQDSIMKVTIPKRESSLLNKEMDSKSVKGTQINSGKYRTKKVSQRWSPSTQPTKQYKSTRSQASRNLAK